MDMIRPALLLQLQPIHSSSADILRCFAEDKPLTAEQVEFLDWHQYMLNHPDMDPLLQYYLKSHAKLRGVRHASFLLPHEIMNLDAIELLKKRIRLFLKEKRDRVSLQLTHQQYIDFKTFTIQEIIYWHGNQFLTGAPFYPGGLPHVIYFQWGNFFGIVKHTVLMGEKAVKGNLLLYFEDMQDRDLNQCVDEDNHHLEKTIELQNTILDEEIKIETHHTAPTLSFGNYFLIHPLHK